MVAEELVDATTEQVVQVEPVEELMVVAELVVEITQQTILEGVVEDLPVAVLSSVDQVDLVS